MLTLWLFYILILQKMCVCQVELKYFAAVLWAKLPATGKSSTCVEQNENIQVYMYKSTEFLGRNIIFY